MIPKIKKILYTTDLSPNSAYAFRYAINSAERHNSDIIILHILELPPATSLALLKDYFDEERYERIMKNNTAETRDQIKNRLKAFCEKELKDDLEVINRVISIQVSLGYPADMILQKAEELDCDAIVMGSHGKGIIRHTFLGSTTSKVLRRSRKPVFIIPLPKGELDITLYDN